LRPTALTDTGVNPAGWPAAELSDAKGWRSGLIGGALLNGPGAGDTDAAPKSRTVGDALLAAATVGDGLAVCKVPATLDA
jgi:hypothetical protein